MGTNFQLHRSAACAAKGIREFQRADRAWEKDHTDRAARHLDKGLKDFRSALGHLGHAAEDELADIAAEIGAGNGQLEKCLEALGDGKEERAEKHYDKALGHYDIVLDMLDR